METHIIARRLGLPWWGIAGLVALAVPRIVIHDLGMSPAPVLQALLALGPPAVWVGVAVAARVPSPVLTLVTVGSLYGLALTVVHNLLWDEVFEGQPPTLGGALTGDLSPGTEETLFRVAMSLSSVFTGMVLGLITGLIATGILVAARRRARPD